MENESKGKEEPALPSGIEDLIKEIKKPFKGYEDYTNPDGTKPSQEQLLDMFKDQIRDWAGYYLSGGLSEEKVKNYINHILGDQEKDDVD